MDIEIRIDSEDPEQPFWWRIVARNGEVLAASETYHNLGDVVDTVDSVMTSFNKHDVTVTMQHTVGGPMIPRRRSDDPLPPAQG